MARGLLIIPVGYNGDTLKNILCILMNEENNKRDSIPHIDTITFMKPYDLQSMNYDGKTATVDECIKRIVNELELEHIELRVKKITAPEIDIPNIIMAAVREVSKDQVVLDLTSGKKDISGSIYTSASICEIKNMVYIEVNKGTDGAFYDLDITDKNMAEKYKITRFQSLNEISQLASLNCMEFIKYKNGLDSIIQKTQSDDVNTCFAGFDAAIDAYFRSRESANNQDALTCIRTIGGINETLTKNLKNYLLKKFPSILNKKGNSKDRNAIIKECNDEYNELYYKSDELKKQTKEETDELNSLKEVFDYVPTLDHMLKTIKLYRNRASHDNSIPLTSEDAKVVIDILLAVTSGLSNARILKEVFEEDANE